MLLSAFFTFFMLSKSLQSFLPLGENLLHKSQIIALWEGNQPVDLCTAANVTIGCCTHINPWCFAYQLDWIDLESDCCPWEALDLSRSEADKQDRNLYNMDRSKQSAYHRVLQNFPGFVGTIIMPVTQRLSCTIWEWLRWFSDVFLEDKALCSESLSVSTLYMYTTGTNVVKGSWSVHLTDKQAEVSALGQTKR